jgi:hypothetical protein
MKFIKEIVAVFLCLVFLAFMVIRNYGNQYKYVGTSKKFINVKNVTEKYPGSREEKCRAIFENFFNVPFKKCRPNWLKNKETGSNLELDGFNPNIISPVGKGVAFEYNGSQHYVFQPKYHKNIKEFEDMQRRDLLKEELCIKHGVILIKIPYTLTDDELEKYIKKKIYQNELYTYIDR